jgi:hypothetical protein
LWSEINRKAKVGSRAETHHRQDAEPAEHHGSEHASDRTGAVTLDQEQPDEHGDGDGQNRNLRVRCGDVQALDRAQDRDRGRDGAVGEEQGRAENAEHPVDLLARTLPLGVDHQGGEREHAALPLVVGVQHDHHVLEQDDEDQRPEDEREHAEDVLGRHRDTGPRETRRHGVQGTRADVAEHDAECGQRQGRQLCS